MFFQWRSRRLRKTAGQFKKKTVDLSRYVKDFYLEDGVAYISCNVKEYNDIIDPYSVNEYEWLTESFVRFVEENANYIPTEYPIILEICGGNFTEEEKKRIVETIQDFYALKLGDKQLDLDQNFRKATILLAWGIVFFGIVWGLQFVDIFDSAKEIILILLWFFVWEFGALVLLDRMDLKQARADAAQLASIKIMFSDKFVDCFEDKKEQDRFIGELFIDVDKSK